MSVFARMGIKRRTGKNDRCCVVFARNPYASLKRFIIHLRKYFGETQIVIVQVVRNNLMIFCKDEIVKFLFTTNNL